MSELNYRQKLSKASKYASTVQNDFRGENKALVNLLIKEAFIAGLDAQLANGVTTGKKQCNLPDVVGRSEQLLAYHRWYLKNRGTLTDSSPEAMVKMYLSK